MHEPKENLSKEERRKRNLSIHRSQEDHNIYTKIKRN